MFIAIIKEDNTIDMGHYQDMFPKTSFTSNGPNESFYAQNNCYKVSMIKDFNSDTETLENCDPYLEDGIVYTVRVVPISNV